MNTIATMAATARKSRVGRNKLTLLRVFGRTIPPVTFIVARNDNVPGMFSQSFWRLEQNSLIADCRRRRSRLSRDALAKGSIRSIISGLPPRFYAEDTCSIALDGWANLPALRMQGCLAIPAPRRSGVDHLIAASLAAVPLP